MSPASRGHTFLACWFLKGRWSSEAPRKAEISAKCWGKSWDILALLTAASSSAVGGTFPKRSQDRSCPCADAASGMEALDLESWGGKTQPCCANVAMSPKMSPRARQSRPARWLWVAPLVPRWAGSAAVSGAPAERRAFRPGAEQKAWLRFCLLGALLAGFGLGLTDSSSSRATEPPRVVFVAGG